MNYALRQRLATIDCLVDQYGTINRAVLCDLFGISVPQASLDLAAYQEMAPQNLVYDKRQKTYVRSPYFQRLWPAV